MTVETHLKVDGFGQFFFQIGQNFTRNFMTPL